MYFRSHRHMLVAAFFFATISPLDAHPESPRKGIESPPPSLHEVSLPFTLRTYLAEQLPQYRPVTQKDYFPGWFDAAHKEVLVDFNWSVRADFDGNGKDDYALFMVGEVDGARRHVLVAVRAEVDGWKHDILYSHATQESVGEKLFVDPPGSVYMGIDKNEESIEKRLRYSSIVMSQLETCGAYRYYWKKGKWREKYIGG